MSDSATPQIISHYQVDSLLGVGAMGSVYLGVDRRDGTLVAIKLIAQFLATDEEFRKRFEREAHVAALLRSPYAVRVLEYGVENGRVFMAMEYVDGPTVRELLDSGPLEPERATRIALQVARALEEAEARGIVHRDVKPDNIILGPEDTAKLADFGVARQDTSMLTQTGGFYGTASYAAPEQFEGKADNRSDIYALGATLYHMLLGRSPVQGDIEQARRRIFAGDIAFADLASWPQLRSVVEQAMKTDPAERYQSARQFAGALESALVSLGGSSPSAAATVAGVPGTEADWRAEEETLRLALKGPTTNLPFGKRYAALKYELAVTNQGQNETKVHLRAADRANACSFSLPESVSVPAGATSHVSFSVSPRKRRLRGPNLTRIFTIAGSRGTGGSGGNDRSGGGGSGGGPPSTVSGRFDDASYSWLPLGMSGLALVVAVAALLVATVGTGASSEKDDGLRIGLLMPFSGQDPNGHSYSDYGPAYLNAAAMAVAEINADGGVLGKPIVVVRGDSGGNPAVGLPEAERLVDEERVQAIIGDLDTLTSTMVAERVTNPAGVVQLRPDDMTLEEADRLPFVFMTSPSPSLEGLALAQLVNESGAQKVCLLTAVDVDEFILPAEMYADALRRSVSDLEMVEVAVTSLESAQDLAVMLGECDGADAIVVNTYPDQAFSSDGKCPDNITSTPLTEALARGTEHVFTSSILRLEIPCPEGRSTSVFDGVGWDEATGVRGTAVTDGRQGDQFGLDFEARFFNDPKGIPHLRQVYDAVYLIALAAEKAGTTDPEAIRAAMREIANAPGTVVNPGSSGGPLVGGAVRGGGFLQVKERMARGEDIDYEGAAGPIEFDAAGQNVRGLVEVWHVDAQAHDFVTERVMAFDRSAGETSAASPSPLDEEAVGSSFVAPVTLTPGAGFALTRYTPTDFSLERTGSASGPDAYLSFLSPAAVYNGEAEEPVPSDLMSWIESNPGLQVVEEARDATVGGHPGKQIDVRNAAAGDLSLLITENSFLLYVVPGEVARLIILDVDGHQIVIAAGPIWPPGSTSPEGLPTLDDVIDDLESMLATVRFEEE